MVTASGVLEEEQAALEAKAVVRWARVERGELTPEAAMGSMDEWMLDSDGRRLLLVPSTREWLYFDDVHGTWESAGRPTSSQARRQPRPQNPET